MLDQRSLRFAIAVCLAFASLSFAVFASASFAVPTNAARFATAGVFAPYVDVTQWPPFAMAQHAQTPNEFSLIFNAFTPSSLPPTPGATFTPSPTPRPGAPTPAPTPSPSSGCVVIYKLTNEWGSGFNADVTIRNHTTAVINGWMLTWRFAGAQTITNSWNGKFTQSGSDVTVKNETWNDEIPVNGSVSVGFGAESRAINVAPSEFRLNGAVCNRGLPSSLSPRTCAPMIAQP